MKKLEPFELNLVKFGEANYIVKDTEEIQAVLDDQIVKTHTLQGKDRQFCRDENIEKKP